MIVFTLLGLLVIAIVLATAFLQPNPTTTTIEVATYEHTRSGPDGDTEAGAADG